MSETTTPSAGSASPGLASLISEAEKAVTICNACRYCEGFCAVFPAIERKLTFSKGDITYLASLCHDCRECYYACQYAPPHEFGLNLPKTLSAVRRETWREYAWPSFMPKLMGNPWLAVFISVIVFPLLFLAGGWLVHGPAALFAAWGDHEGAFYALMPHTIMASIFGALGLFVIVAMGMSWRAFRQDISEDGQPRGGLLAGLRATHNAMTLRYLGSSGDGCAYPDGQQSQRRRYYHHLTFYGFLLCLASTSVATVYHYLYDLPAPYPFLSLPVILGTLGGIGLLVGPAGLLYLKKVRDSAPSESGQTVLDISLLVLLFLVALTGLALMLLRETSWMGGLLLVHLGLVAGLFLTMPYGKFVHGLYRYAALLRSAREEKST